ncbi:hypothetical protein FB567DRAFT_588095 [Paraphoma chrysanthemicola]|uniref:Uncharacterized protein n=1 Tax=Paraphoma chrysanthemicola TaxID=798071 RepID=A0A8K0RFJ6_9PLEO|nr:hypothetical protein FB567DRAFT_588095 [Paraphoma chrysanthemicola]
MQSVPLHPGPGTGPPPYFTDFTPSSSGSATPSKGPQPPKFPPQRSIPVPTPASDRADPARSPSMNGGSVHLNPLAGNHPDIAGHEASLRGRERALQEKQAALDRRAAEIADGEAALTHREAAFADIVDRELAIARRQEKLDIRDAILQSRASQMTRLEAGTEKLKRVCQHLNAREVSLNNREAIYGGHQRCDISLHRRKTILVRREAEVERYMSGVPKSQRMGRYLPGAYDSDEDF